MDHLTEQQQEHYTNICKYCEGKGYDIFNKSNPCPNCQTKPVIVQKLHINQVSYLLQELSHDDNVTKLLDLSDREYAYNVIECMTLQQYKRALALMYNHKYSDLIAMLADLGFLPSRVLGTLKITN